MTFLTTVTETYRIDSEEEVEQMLEDAKKDSRYVLAKYTSTFKERKSKGEVIDSYYRVSLTKEFTDEKEPDVDIQISYNKGGSASAF